MDISIIVFVNAKPLTNSDLDTNGVRSVCTRDRRNAPLFRGFIALLLPVLFVQGCILIRTTEHRIQLRDDGSGEAVLRLIDLRSDESADSSVARDCAIMMASFEKTGIGDFEKDGRKVTGKRFFVQGDTLSAEIAYTFPSLGAVEGLRIAKDGVFVVVKPGREIVRTNGTIESWENDHTRIVWPRNARRFFFRIRERSLPPSRSLTQAYLQWMQEH